jgi:hypothetical protein
MPKKTVAVPSTTTITPEQTETQTETPPGFTRRSKQNEVTFVMVTMAEAEGFEPPVPLGTLAFKASALDRSATLPSAR